MNRIQAIEAPVAEEMKAFRKHFREAMRTDVALLDTITRYILRRNGKQMRPLFVFLTARLQGEWAAAGAVSRASTITAWPSCARCSRKKPPPPTPDE
jgi:geranylgeranyl pyrophosphate synthase